MIPVKIAAFAARLVFDFTLEIASTSARRRPREQSRFSTRVLQNSWSAAGIQKSPGQGLRDAPLVSSEL
jgi:hypothetical protein